jgi:nucleotide-binding universal stress UspA family protein
VTSPGTGDVTHGGSVSGDHPEATSGVGGSRPVTPVVVGGPAGSRRATLDDVRGVVVAWDPSPAAATATAWGVAEAKRRGRPLWLVHADEWGVAHLGWRLGHAARRRMSAAAHEALRRAVAATAAEHPDVPVRGCLLAALAPQLLLAVSDRADVVVVGSEGLGGVTRMLLGSTSRAGAAGGGCPTVVVRHPGSAGAPRGGDAPVVVGIAGDAAGEAALDAAADWAAGTRRPLVVVRAWSVPPAPDLDDVPDTL